MTRFRGFSELPILVGFGIKDGASARAVANLSDGAVVGSAIVQIMGENQDEPEQLSMRVESLVKELRLALDA